jgi:hypothetical protein
MNRRDFLLAAGVTGAMGLSRAAENSADKGKRLLQECLTALGGQGFLSMQDRVESGRAYSFYNEKLTGLSKAKIYTRHLDNAAAGEIPVRERQAFGKDEDSSVLFMGKDGYELTFRGARPLPEPQIQRYVESYYHNFFYILRHRMQEPGMIFEAQASDVLVNEPVEVLDVTDAENRVTTIYLHYSTKFPIRQKFFRRDPKTKDRHEEISEYSKFRDVGGGVKWPYAIRKERDGEKLYEIYSEHVAINQSLPDSSFNLPAGVKMLKQA